MMNESTERKACFYIVATCKNGHEAHLSADNIEHNIEGSSYHSSEHAYLEWACEPCRESFTSAGLGYDYRDILTSIRL